VKLDYLNTQGQPHFTWPATFALARAYVDQLERSRGLPGGRIADVRKSLTGAEQASGGSRRNALTKLASALEQDAGASADASKVRLLAGTVRELSGM
jgi:hypothetical protein